jgi:hypothetical protein
VLIYKYSKDKDLEELKMEEIIRQNIQALRFCVSSQEAELNKDRQMLATKAVELTPSEIADGSLDKYVSIIVKNCHRLESMKERLRFLESLDNDEL